MPVLDDFCRKQLEALDEQGLRRAPVTTKRLPGGYIIRDGHRLLSFCCNDYLGISTDREVEARAEEILHKYSDVSGGGASRLISGNHPLYDTLEAKLAELKGTEAACVFGSGYLANISVIPAMMGRDDLIIADKLSHACMIDGARLSGASFHRFSHNDLEHCRSLLEAHRASARHCLILTEGVFSMDGDRAPLEDLLALAREYNSWLYVDDAHGMGVLGLGRGSAAEADVRGIHVQMGTLSKAVGAYGGYLCASKPVIDFVKSTARGLIYTTALPPIVLAQALAGLEVIEDGKERTARPLMLARRFTEALELPEAQSAIVPLVVGEPQDAVSKARVLEEAGFLVSAIRPPTVPAGTARLRFTFSSAHSKVDVDRLVEAVKPL